MKYCTFVCNNINISDEIHEFHVLIELWIEMNVSVLCSLLVQPKEWWENRPELGFTSWPLWWHHCRGHGLNPCSGLLSSYSLSRANELQGARSFNKTNKKKKRKVLSWLCLCLGNVQEWSYLHQRVYRSCQEVVQRQHVCYWWCGSWHCIVAGDCFYFSFKHS